MRTKRIILILLFVVFAAASLSVGAQVKESGYGRRLALSAGAEGSLAQPDYAGRGIAENSPNHLMGIGGFVDMRLSRWITIEGEARFLRFNEYLGIDETTYQIGPRIPIVTVKRVTPYGKLLFGMGQGTFLTGTSTVLSYGGGVDYRLGNKFSVRAFDYEAQRWNVNPTLNPWTMSAGLSYRIF